jgi:hypothetical protein
MYIETMSQIYANTNKVFVDENAGKNIIPYLPAQTIGKPAVPPMDTVTVTAPSANAAASAAASDNGGNQ